MKVQITNISQIFTIPKDETKLSLCGVLFSKQLTLVEFSQVFAATTAVTDLDLSWNGLGNSSVEELVQIFSAIPATVTSLDLIRNCLGVLSGAELVRVFSAIPATVISLKLAENSFSCLTGADRGKFIQCLLESGKHVLDKELAIELREARLAEREVYGTLFSQMKTYLPPEQVNEIFEFNYQSHPICK